MKQVDPSNWTRYDFVKFYSEVWGCPVLPIHPNKKPAVKEWNCYKERMPTPEELDTWFVKQRAWGLTLILKHNLFCLDFDKPEAYELFKDRIPALVTAGACIAKTPRGYHVILRSSGPTETIKGGNQQLISCLEKISPLLIEVDSDGKRAAKIDILGDNSLLHSPDSPGYTWLELYEEPATINFAQLLADLFGYMHRISDFKKTARQGGGLWTNIFCPWCEFDGKKHDSPSCSIDIDGGGYKCHGSCGKQGKLTELIEYAKGVNYPLPQAAYDWESDFKERQSAGQGTGKRKIIDLTPIPWNKVKRQEGGKGVKQPLITGLLPSGENAKLVIFGSPKSGRTTLGLSICVPLSKGEPALKKLPTLRPLKIAYGNPEQSGDDLSDQILRMEGMYGLPSADMFHLLPLCGINQDGDMFRIKLNRPEHSGPLLEQLIKGKFDLFFLDSINFGIDDNIDTEQVSAVINFLSDVIDKAHCALIITDHTKESGERLRPWDKPSPLGKLGHELERWAGSRLFYTDVTDSLSDYYGKLSGDIRSGIGKVEYYVAYTGITDSVQIVPISSVPMMAGIEARTTRKSARVKEFQQLVVYAEGLGYNRAALAAALKVSEVSVSNWFRGEKEPGDENWLGIQLVRERLEKTGGLGDG